LIGELESPGRLPDDGVSDPLEASDFICAANRESERERLSETETDSERDWLKDSEAEVNAELKALSDSEMERDTEPDALSDSDTESDTGA
jgi:hypothetical protein